MSDQPPPTYTGEPTNQTPPDIGSQWQALGYIKEEGQPSGFVLAGDASDRAPLLGTYHATLELATLQGAIVNARVTVEGSALVVEQVLAAAAVAFREDAER